MKSRLLICALFLCFILSHCRAESAILLEQDSSGLEAEPAFYAAAGVGSRVYLCDADSHQYFIYDLEDGTLRTQSSITILEQNAEGTAALYDTPLALTQSDGALYSVELRVQVLEEGMQFTGANLYRLEGDDLARTPVCALDFSDIYVNDVEFSDCPPCKSLLLAGGCLCLLFDSPAAQADWLQDEASTDQALLIFDCATGARRRMELSGAFELVCSYEDQIIVARAAPESGDAILSGYAPDSGKFRDYLRLSGEGDARPEHIFYDARAGELFYCVGNHLWGIRRAEPERAAIVSNLPSVRISALLPLGDGQIAAYSPELLCSVHPDWASEGALRTLTLSGPVNAEGFRLSHPDVQIDDITEWGSKKITEGILTRASLPDVLILNPSDDMSYRTLRNRGYLLPIQDKALLAFADTLHGDLRRAASNADGALCAIPIGLIPQRMLAIDEELRAEIGMERPPQSWPEMLSLLENWPGWITNGTPVFPFDRGGAPLRQQLLSAMLRDYDLYRWDQEEDPGYDTPELRALLAQLERINFDVLDPGETEDARALFQTGFFAFVKGYHPSERRGLPLAISEGEAARLPVGVLFAAVNPYSQNQELALEFLRYQAANLDPYVRIEILPGESGPLRADGYEEAIATSELEVESLRARLDAAGSEDRPELQRALEEAERELADTRENSWGASPEGIAAFRAIAQDYGILYSDALNTEDMNVMDQIYERFFNGETDSETFIQEMDRRIRMRALED